MAHPTPCQHPPRTHTTQLGETHLSLYQVRILAHLRHPKTFHKIRPPPSPDPIHIPYTRVPPRLPHLTNPHNRLKRLPRRVLEPRVPRRAVRVVQRLEHLGAQDVGRGGDIEAVGAGEGGLGGRGEGVGGGGGEEGVDPLEGFGADLGEG